MKNKAKMLENTQTPAQEVAADFVAQYTDEDLHIISNMSLTNLKEHMQAVMASGLEFATSILPGRPDRPKKPQV